MLEPFRYSIVRSLIQTLFGYVSQSLRCRISIIIEVISRYGTFCFDVLSAHDFGDRTLRSGNGKVGVLAATSTFHILLLPHGKRDISVAT